MQSLAQCSTFESVMPQAIGSSAQAHQPLANIRELAIGTDRIEREYRANIVRFSLLGSAVGCVLGVHSLSLIPDRGSMYSVIVPFSATYAGLAGGLFGAMLTKFVKSALCRDSIEKSTIPHIHGQILQRSFSDYRSANEALSSLIESGVRAEQITVIGTDCDQLRDCTAPLQSKKFAPIILFLAAIGSIVGAYWGYIASPLFAAPGAVISSTMAMISGATLGIICGAHIGAIVHLDNGPTTEASIIDGTVDNDLLAVSVQIGENDDANKVEAIVNADVSETTSHRYAA